MLPPFLLTFPEAAVKDTASDGLYRRFREGVFSSKSGWNNYTTFPRAPGV